MIRKIRQYRAKGGASAIGVQIERQARESRGAVHHIAQRKPVTAIVEHLIPDRLSAPIKTDSLQPQGRGSQSQESCRKLLVFIVGSGQQHY